MNDPSQITQTIRSGMDMIAHRTFLQQMRFVKSTGLSLAQFGILMQLHHQHHCGVSDISNRMDITSAAASQLVDKLVQGGLLIRAEDPIDRRAKQLKLSEKGQELMEASLAARHRLLDAVLDRLDDEERGKVAEAMEILSRIFQQIQEQENHLSAD